ncbi:TlpA disulfide reductase family protein [Pseudoxanthomonas winnipegensis]|uniref:TlpA family protein disulfide reductase n=1 Tax=Pseudoxanthomonas winnipegensis TaxID=2480810 RepID=A0A4Q8M172_9GAMM|nr:TlpA disulfide reductase family protein [Pseudoxanthomonas winnipegensis]RZZ86768.1 TlpA family protein disulfide reductase [Pseudoxanthomonas winnipegensis]TAA38060.1 TlpA family protein disulfide reductase [Pseudoxanthomonas winnipegensis]
MRTVSFAFLLLALPALASAATPEARSWVGQWQATADNGTARIPFRYDIVEGKQGLVGSFFNGDEPVTSTAARGDDHHLQLRYDAFDRVLDLTRNPDGSLSGTYSPVNANAKAVPWKISARRGLAQQAADAGAPDVEGLWVIPAKSKKANEFAWRFMVHQEGGRLSASVLRVGGDTGALTGTWKNGQFDLANFSGTRAALATVKPARDDKGNTTLDVGLSDREGFVHYTAYRPEVARRLGLPDVPDLGKHTSVRDPDEVFAFSFKDLQGRLVSNTDARFRNKVLLVDVSGSWCPNCHDEAPFLEALYRKYHAQGLEIVTLDFEDQAEYADPARLRAFIDRYKPQFPVLLAGTTDQVQEKLPQAVNLDSWPTTFFIGRDGKVKHVHSGFSAKATGRFNGEVHKEFDSQIQSLLARK